jgi:hypothetical protein
MNRNLLFSIFLLTGLPSAAQTYKIYGRVSNARLEPLAFASVQIKDMHLGSVTKESGSYEILVDDGVYDLVVSMIGYKNQVIKVVVNKADHLQNVILELDDSRLGEVIVKGKIRDRSEEIIRQVIRRKESILAAAGNYSANVYIKAIQEDSTAPKKRKKALKDTAAVNPNADLQRMAMTEISIKYDRAADGRAKEERLGVKKRGNAEALFYLSTTEGDFNFYSNLVNVPSISSTPFLSPVSYSGLLAYRFRMLKMEQVKGQKIYTISVKPGKLSNATVEGEITIADSTWVILHTRFTLPSYHLPEYDFFEVEQQYNHVHDTAWMISRQQFTYYSKRNKAKKSGTTLVTYRDFELNKSFEKKYFGTEVSKATSEAYTRDSSFWQQARTEPLTQKEIRFIRYRDSIYNATNTKEYLDSIDAVTNKVTWKKVVFLGQPIYSREKERLWLLQPLVSLYQPFSFGGTRIYPSVFYSKTYKSRRYVSLFANVNYGLRNKDINGNLSFTKMYNPFNRAFYRVEINRDFKYIFEGDAWINMIKRSNQFLDNSLGLSHGRELVNGLFLETDLDFAFRRSVARYKTNPQVDSLLGDLLENNRAIDFDPYNAVYGQLQLRYTPRQRYIREPREKIILGSAWPTFYASWRKGIPGPLNSKVNFDYLEFGVQQTIKLGLVGISSYTVRTGSFLNKTDLRLVDYKFQRRGDPLLFLNPNEAFQSLDSTFPVFKRFYEGHYVHEFNGAIINKIPFLKKLQLREIAGAGFLLAPERGLRYAEMLAGIERVFKAPFNIPSKFKLGVYIVGSVSNQFHNPVQFKVGLTTWDRRRNKWF